MNTSILRISKRLAIISIVLVVALAQGATPAHASTYTVTTTADDGPGSLRRAITDANNNAGADVIAFAVPGCGPGTTAVCTIALMSALPAITEAVTMDGALTSSVKLITAANSPGVNPTGLAVSIPKPGIELDGTNAGLVNGLRLSGHDGSTIKGFIINNFDWSFSPRIVTAAIRIDPSSNHLIEGNFLGTDPTGTISKPNIWGGIFMFRVDDTTVTKNLIAGSIFNILGLTASDNTFSSNVVGTKIGGQGELGVNGGGIVLSGNRNIIEDNIFKHADTENVDIFQAIDYIVRRNTISEGKAYGVLIINRSDGTLIEDNVIENNALHGISIGGGTFSISLGSSNTNLNNPAKNTIVIGNRVSGNGFAGVLVGDDIEETFNAYCDASAGAASFLVLRRETLVPPGNYIDLVVRFKDVFTTIIEGNGDVSIVGGPDGENDSCQVNDLARNRDTVVIPFLDQGRDDTINNSIIGNSIFNNGGLGIDISNGGTLMLAFRPQNRTRQSERVIAFDDGVTANDLKDEDAGPNNLQNFPTMTSARLKDGDLRVHGRLMSERNKSYRLDFYASPAGTSAPVEGQTHLGFIEVGTNGGGNTNYDTDLVVVGGSVEVGTLITATATEVLGVDIYGSTSEFSAATAVN